MVSRQREVEDEHEEEEEEEDRKGGRRKCEVFINPNVFVQHYGKVLGWEEKVCSVSVMAAI